MFDLDDDTMINLESIDYVRFGRVEGQKSVFVGVGGVPFVVPVSRHKDFFEQLLRMGSTPNKQFVSL